MAEYSERRTVVCSVTYLVIWKYGVLSQVLLVVLISYSVLITAP